MRCTISKLFCGLLLCAAAGLSLAAQTIVVPRPSQDKKRAAANVPPGSQNGAGSQPAAAETKLKAVRTLLPSASGGSSSSVQLGESIVLDVGNLKTPKGSLILQNLNSLYPNLANFKGSKDQPGRIIVQLDKLTMGKYLLIFDVEFSEGSGIFYLVKPGGVYDEVNYPNGRQKVFFIVDAQGASDIFRLEAEFNFTFRSVEAVQLKQ